ncbi:protein-glutamate O-methyltransferase CheR [Virgisporangium ochraceum]|uniref:protein-glutamate O-methyltransferase n=1 Tax=Virgisporangium ochraceum TaxID=65505 RepID=A0A8J3ZWP5_9ACTN|nr:protein-glutamate O-methyltransferase CheR [Virgisporangium ochraceum]GIJ69840.1 chemotaxis protein methyltransferase [Virgisporangium ochraceum]
MTLSASEFAYVSQLVRREAAIVLEPGKEYLVEARLTPVARQCGAATVSEFVMRAQQKLDPETQRRIIDALTTNETSFFRDGEPFAAMTNLVLPELISNRSATRQVRIWSAACSSGQEAYTLAMQMEDNLPGGWTYEIVGTDISTEVLAKAEAGKFSQLEVNRGLPATSLVKHFERVGAHWQVSQKIRRNVSFKRLNLASSFPPMPHFDVIFIRNVLIYFDVATKRAVLNRVRALLKPDGWLFLGSAETTIGIDEQFDRVVTGRTSAYRLRSAAAKSAPTPLGVAGKR